MRIIVKSATHSEGFIVADRTNATVGVAMNQTPNELWLSFEALANTYPRDEGVRITAHLARWLVEERQRLQIPIPTVLQKVVEAVEKEVASPDSPPGRIARATA
jgi:hypothetical protein